MNTTFPSLLTSDAQTGLALAGSLADELQSQIDQASSKVERLGGMNYLLPAQVPKELTASILFLRYCYCQPRLADQGLTNTCPARFERNANGLPLAESNPGTSPVPKVVDRPREP